MPLTAVERLLLSYDTPARPMTIRVRLQWDRPVDADLLRRAAVAATPRHPLLTATTDGREWSTPGVPPPINFVESNDADGGSPGVSSRPHAERLRGSRRPRSARLPKVSGGDAPGVAVTHRGDVTDLDFHHACCDGQGGRQWGTDFFLTADAFARGVQPDLPRLDNSLLETRGDLSHPAGVEPITGGEGLRNLRLTTRGRTARLRGEEPGERLWERTYSPEETASLRKRLAAAGLTMNDAGLVATFRALAETPGLTGGRVTVLNPVDLRKPSDLRMPAANKLGFAYLRRTRAEIAGDIAASVVDQMRYVKDRFAGAEFVRGLELVQDVPGVLRALRLLGKFVPTAQFTCLGDSTRGRRHGLRRDGGAVLVGEARLLSISGFAPLSPGVPLSLAACETANRLSLTARSALPQAATEDFAGRWADHLFGV